MEIEIAVGDPERLIVIVDYNYHSGSKGHGARDDCPGCPPEPAEVEDIEAIWKDNGQPLTDDEFFTYSDVLEEACFEDAAAQIDAGPDE